VISLVENGSTENQRKIKIRSAIRKIVLNLVTWWWKFTENQMFAPERLYSREMLAPGSAFKTRTKDNICTSNCGKWAERSAF
jgi:hypothetical protein